MKPLVTSKGICVCMLEPRGDTGLEGYVRNGEYRYEKVLASGGLSTYYRVFPGESLDYFETCGSDVFQRFFKILPEEEFKALM